MSLPLACLQVVTRGRAIVAFEKERNTPLVVTLDNNCIIALEREELTASAMRALLELHRAGTIKLIVGLSIAFDLGRDKNYRDFGRLYERMNALGLADVELFAYPQTIGFLFPHDQLVYSRDLEMYLAAAIHQVLFPNTGFTYRAVAHREDYLKRHPHRALHEITEEDVATDWMNHKNDAYGLYAHVSWLGDIFVTDDGRFHKKEKKSKLKPLVPGEILRPQEAVTYIHRVTNVQKEACNKC